MEKIISDLKKELDSLVEGFKHELSGIRTGRANSILVENIMVESYGQKAPLKQLGAISVNPPKTITVQVWDQSLVNNVVKAIDNADLGVTPNADGNTIHINLPPLTAERRKELIKHVGKLAEERRIAIRKHREEARKDAEDLPSEDDQFRTKEKIQEVVEKANKNIEEALNVKVKEIEE